MREMSEKSGEGGKKARPIGKITILIGLFAVFLIPVAIFVPMFAVAFGGLPLSEMERMQTLAGLFALAFGMIFVGFVLSAIRVLKESKKENET